MYIIGLMSGTSLDGLDIALCEFNEVGVKNRGPQPITYSLIAAETVPYSNDWLERLATLESASAYDYALANVQLGHYWGRLVNEFRDRHPHIVDAIASHGHTIFHQPQMELTTQIGDGDAIAAETGLLVVHNFRTLDVALGGQGAPLVPIGDYLLFGDYDACRNLGGISKISLNEGATSKKSHSELQATRSVLQPLYDNGAKRIAFDISPCNMALNYLSRRLGRSFDCGGDLAAKGALVPELLEQMNALDYYRMTAPKSLGKEWFVEQFQHLLSVEIPTIDLLRTTVEHIAIQISSVVNANKLRTMMVTGGGALNSFLMQRIGALSPQCQITVPDQRIIEYKEALIFALLGYLRITCQTNTLSSVTGAIQIGRASCR